MIVSLLVAVVLSAPFVYPNTETVIVPTVGVGTRRATEVVPVGVLTNRLEVPEPVTPVVAEEAVPPATEIE